MSVDGIDIGEFVRQVFGYKAELMFLERSLTNAFRLSICPENSCKIIGFFTHQFSAKFAQKILAKLAVFSANLSLKIP